MTVCIKCPCPAYDSDSPLCFGCLGKEITFRCHVPCRLCRKLICSEHNTNSFRLGVCYECRNVSLLDMTERRLYGGVYIPSYLDPAKHTPHRNPDPAQPCPICHDALHVDFTVLNCKHAFHIDCLAEWAKRQPTCPMCRTFISRSENQWDVILMCHK